VKEGEVVLSLRACGLIFKTNIIQQFKFRILLNIINNQLNYWKQWHNKRRQKLLLYMYIYFYTVDN